KLIITEINNTSSYVEMLRLCAEKKHEYELEIATGIEFRKENHLLYVALAKNNEGFEELNRFLSYHNNTSEPLPERPLSFEHAFCIFPWGNMQPENLQAHEFIGIQPKNLSRFTLDKNYKAHPEKYVILHPVTFIGKRGFNLHRILRAIGNNVVLSKLPAHLQADKQEYMLSEKELAQKYQLFPALLQNTKKLIDACSIQFDLGVDKNKQTITGNPDDDWMYLVTQAREGLQKRYNAYDEVLEERFNRELNTIKKKGFTSYYLIAYDLILFAQKKGFDHVGRGSGANSLVAYCLGITNVDPLELDLYFERFLNEERVTPPDFDIDFSWTDRDTVYEYLFERYGKDHVCLLGSYATFKLNAAVRELGKVFGLPKEEIDNLADAPEQNKKRDHIAELIFRYAAYMKEMPAHLSIHAGGILITEKPIYHYTATELPPKGYPVSFLDMYGAEDMGIFKLDVLSQRGLGHIKDTVKLVKKNKGIDIDVYRFHDFKQDERVRSLLKSSKAMGCFYIESPAMRTLIAKLNCEDYLTLVAASSIIRPGVARSGMMKAYIERYHAVRNGKGYESIHPKMDELMSETFGVMVYQEDVIKVAHEFAKLTLTEADVLRRAMSGKYRTRKSFDEIRGKFFSNCKKIGYEKHVIDRVWLEIESFSGYSFAKGHSASYAVESYQSLYLKAYYPLEFIVAVINNFGGFYRREFYFHEARMLGGKVEAPCVNHSEYTTNLIDDKIYIGFIHIKSLEQKYGESIALEREKHGAFKSLADFLKRIPLGLEQISILIQIGAFRFIGRTKQELKWDAMLYFSHARQHVTATGSLFEEEQQIFDMPVLETHPLQDAFDEIELLEFPLCDPFLLLATKDYGDTTSCELTSRLGKEISIVGYVVDIKNTSTRNG
ncbi:MAG TPA: DNA polymerase III subunit alpha, partial [Cyclobacteriaceae bacterium]